MPVKVVFFNVGQGDCTLITFYQPGATKAHAAVLLDCGSKPGGEVAPRSQAGAPAAGTAKQRLIAHLRKRIDDHLRDLVNPGVLDYLLISHPDEDHFNLFEDVLCDPATGKLRCTLNNVWYSMGPDDYKERSKTFVKTLLTNPAALVASGGHVPEVKLKPDEGFPEKVFTGHPSADANLYLVNGGAFAHPGYSSAEKERLANLCSLIFLVVGEDDGTGKRQKALLMADALVQNEKALITLDSTDPSLKREKNLWLKVGHHGSKTSTCRQWLEYTTPDALFVSTGPLLFGGKTATCTDTDFHQRMLTDWEDVRDAHNIPDPKVTRKKPRIGHWGFGFQDDTGTLPWKFKFEDMTGRGVFSTLGGAPLPPDPSVPGSPAGEWTGLDWTLWIGRDEYGKDDAGAYTISFE
ncbi:ComEC/Rec2 family competence protein [Streptomyces hesseae]|uniref:Metallo-beta-lactamase domain-containing protein n=1 Tax=Streptomyces hesseae TaxID=3075519 RepID=A0ABU2SJR9_9ACTN|nr:hypothetical protein [Streptomyces sp. DSM 40473]MDT0449222.1 hypothetical protein [Streptomyces sp. DSM 40473]